MESLNVKVENMVSPTSGNEVPNQFIVTVGNKRYFQSYSTMIAMIETDSKGLDQVYLDCNCWNNSNTTNKYRNKFLGGIASKKVKERIEQGRYILMDLNKDN